jgi:hypothetical protein
MNSVRMVTGTIHVPQPAEGLVGIPAESHLLKLLHAEVEGVELTAEAEGGDSWDMAGEHQYGLLALPPTSVDFLCGLQLDTESERDIFLRNVGLSPNSPGDGTRNTS